MMICQNCGKEFEPDHKGAKFCSRGCYLEDHRNPRMVPRECETCGNVFAPDKPERKYCSLECYWESMRYPPQTCENCGKEFPYRKNTVNRFCSPECASEAQRDRIEIVCETCSETFEVTRSRYECRNVRFCSRECKTEAGRTKLTCEVCGKTIDVRRHKVESGKYTGRFCSYECAAEWQKGENHSNWQGGYEKWRGPNWNEQRNKTRKRDDYTCRRCSITENELDRPLDVHHIVPWHEFDHDWKAANKLDNLVSLCPHCHTTVERNDDVPSPRNHTTQ